MVLTRLFIILVLLFFQLGCSEASPNNPFDSTYAEVLLEGKSLGNFELEVADTPSKRSLGLMYRKDLSSQKGMVFVYPNESVNTFWMKNTYISLDMLFLNRARKVVGILHDVPVLNQEERSVDLPSQYVIELSAGTAKRVGIEKGAEFKFAEELKAN